MISQIFNPTAEILIPTGTQTNETNAEIETQLVTVETKIRKAQLNLNTYMSFYTFHSLNHYVLFLVKDNFLLYLFFVI